MNTIKNFTQYNLYAFLILVPLPLIYFLLPKVFNSYFDAFDKLSIPLWAALYSLFWLNFNRQIKKTERQISSCEKRISSFEKVGNKEYLPDYKSDKAQLSNDKIEIAQLRLHFDFVNETLRISLIVSAIIKIIQLIYNIII
ncbi:MAG: hypothetical protein ABJB05_16380 [Parafilimonas sp.]